jgi:hypothetical protein
MNQIHLLSLAVVLAVSASAVVAQGSAASKPAGASMSQMDCSKAAKQKHDHAAESGRGTPHMQAHPCPADNSASAASAAAAKKKASHSHQSTK